MKLIVFDLDQTLWRCDSTWIDQSAGSPFKRISKDMLVDRDGGELSLFRDSREILKNLAGVGYELVVASRSKAPAWAKEALDNLELTKFFTKICIYPGSKLKHFSEIRQACGCEYRQMVFFDDEMRNIDEISALGVETIFISEGINLDIIDEVLGLPEKRG